MSDIPSDIVNAASKAYMSQLEQGETAITAGEHKAVCIEEIAKAIYEERKRCAKIAETIDVEVKTMAGCSRQNEMTKSTISKAILSGETKD